MDGRRLGLVFVHHAFYKKSPADFRERVEKFFTTMRAHIDFETEVGASKDHAQSRLLGILCFIYGGFVLLLTLIPIRPSGGPLLSFAAR